jgi:hypothetical protein
LGLGQVIQDVKVVLVVMMEVYMGLIANLIAGSSFTALSGVMRYISSGQDLY